MKKTAMLMAALMTLGVVAEETAFDSRQEFDEGLVINGEDLVVMDGADVTAPWFKFATDDSNANFTMTGGRLTATAGNGKFGMPCGDVDYDFCLGYGAGYVIADLAGGVIECTNGLFTVSKAAYTTCMVTGTVIRCRGFRLQADESSGYATFILGQGGELEITGEWGIRGYHDDSIQKNYVVGDKDFRYYFEMRGGKIKFSNSYNHPGRGDLAHSPCLIMAPDTESEFEVTEGNYVHYAGQLQGQGTLRKTGEGTLVFASGFIHNEGAIVIEEGAVEMFYPSDASRFWGDVIVKPGARLIIKGDRVADMPDLIPICQQGSPGTVTVEEGGTVYYRNVDHSHNDDVIWEKPIDMTKNTENGGYIETRSRYRLGVNMNTGTTGWKWNGDSVVVQTNDTNVGAYPESGSTWGATREIRNGEVSETDIMRIYSRADISQFVRFAYWMGCSGANTCPTPFTNGNMRVTKRYFDDGLPDSAMPGNMDVVVATNYLYKAEQIVLPAPPNARGWQIRLEEIPYAEFDIYLIYACNNPHRASTKFAPAKIRVTTPDGKEHSEWVSYSYDTEEKQTIRSEANWGAAAWCEATNMVEGVNYLRIHLSSDELAAIGILGLNDLVGVSVDITHGPVSDDYNNQVRGGLAGFQIVPLGEPKPELDINEYTAFTADSNIYYLKEGDEFTLHFSATNENSSIGFVHSISNDVHIAPRILVKGREYPSLPGEGSRYTFSASNSDKLLLDVKYLPWMDNQTNVLTASQLAWVTNRWGTGNTVSNRTLSSASAIAGADSDGDRFTFQEEWAMNADLTKDSNPMRLCIVGRAVSNDCLWLDVEYTRTENGLVVSNDNVAVAGWTGITNGVGNEAWLQLGVKGGGRFCPTNDDFRAIAPHSRGSNPQFTVSVTNTIALPLVEMTNRFFRATMEPK